jgi:hypothetical protein
MLLCSYYNLAMLTVMVFSIEILAEEQALHSHAMELLALFSLSMMLFLLTTSLAIKFLRFRDSDERTDDALRQEMQQERFEQAQALKRFISMA